MASHNWIKLSAVSSLMQRVRMRYCSLPVGMRHVTLVMYVDWFI